MNHRPISEISLATPAHFEVARHEFFEVLGNGIVVLLTSKDALGQARSPGGSRRHSGGEIGAWLHISEEESVTVYIGKVEMGQNIHTSLTQVVAEELPVPLSSIRLVMGDTDLSPFDRGTAGSRSTPTMAPQLRKVAAAARELLMDLAAQRWEVDRNYVVIADGKLTHSKTGRSFNLGRLTQGQKLMKTVDQDVPTMRKVRLKSHWRRQK